MCLTRTLGATLVKGPKSFQIAQIRHFAAARNSLIPADQLQRAPFDYFTLQGKAFLMSPRVLSIGQCGPDQAAISGMLRDYFNAQVTTADRGSDALEQLRQSEFELILINRKLDVDYSDGMLILEDLQADEQFRTIPVMLISNFSEWQEKAVAAGALYGFGKAELQAPETIQRLEEVLGGAD